ncbi:MAG: hypothetical protein ACRDTD_15460 [Pseudonocardiaceae bacterium]
MRTSPASRTFVKIGQGVHSEVFHRPGSRFVVQVFKPDCPELTVDKLHREYTYLCAIYAAMPRLIPRQQLVTPRADAPLQESALVKDYIPHRPELALHRVDPARLRPTTLDQIRQFLHITRGLLTDTRPHPDVGGEASMVPDVIDPDWANLVIDIRTDDLTLIDTNRLISTHKLAQLYAAGQPLDVGHRPIHALLLRRLMYLDSKYLDKPRAVLGRDPVYTRYLDSAGFELLFAESAAAGEHIR